MGLLKREDGRAPDELRTVTFTTNYTQYAEGSVLAKFGSTHILCNVTLEEDLPAWIKAKAEPHGWVTAEYALLPRSTQRRVGREQRWPRGRTQEISRLIGRSLRMAVNLSALGPRQIIIDCDVLQADGGTRTAAITGAWVALQQALKPLIQEGVILEDANRHQIAAVSAGIVGGIPMLDLAYNEDAGAEVDLNLVMTATGHIVEVQGTAEKSPFSRDQQDALLDLARVGIENLLQMQRQALL